MLTIVVVVPTIVMTFAYTAISKEVTYINISLPPWLREISGLAIPLA